MKRLSIIPVLILVLVSCTDSGTERISILETTDLHGTLLPYDYVERRSTEVSLASVATYIKQLRQNEGEIVLLDNGDNLQGQPLVYYYNFIDTASPHINSRIMNYLEYDAASVGNHDIEAGHDVYDRLVREYDFPLLAANAVRTSTGEPYFKPYVIINKKGLRIAVFGLITPAVPTWLPPELYEGMEFRDMLETAREWMPVIKKEKPDIVAGLFHAGWRWDESGQQSDAYMDENGSAAIAREVPGFDIIFTGHDHNPENTKLSIQPVILFS
jgi:2',3'-cyclic-nucleotide 2'-phosphodiesterase/3'-nucleotidase